MMDAELENQTERTFTAIGLLLVWYILQQPIRFKPSRNKFWIFLTSTHWLMKIQMFTLPILGQVL